MTFVVPFPGGGVVRRLFKYSITANPAAASVDFTSVPFDAPADNRSLGICVAARPDNASISISGVTVDGNAATERAAAQASDFYKVKIFQIAYPGGSSGTVTVNGSGTLLLVGVSVYALYGATFSHSATSGSATNPQSVSLNVPANGCGIAVGANSSITNTWSGLSEDIDTNIIGSLTTLNLTSASADFTTQQTGLTVSRSMSVTSFPCMAAVSFAP